jgi:hypothetical protein
MRRTLGSLVIVGLFACAGAQAQMPQWSKAQEEVWGVVSASWADEQAQNGKWPSDYTHENYASMGDTSLAPRMRSDSIRWSEFGNESISMLIYQITPLAIQMAGDTAVVFYAAETVTENSEEEREQESRFIVETLVKGGGSWKFLAGANFQPDVDD